MKIFSLETKKHLVGWSLIVGFIINHIILVKTFVGYASCLALNCPDSYGSGGWPFKIVIEKYTYDFGWLLDFKLGYFKTDIVYYFGFYVNIFFWIFICLIILSLIRHLQTKRTTSV